MAGLKSNIKQPKNYSIKFEGNQAYTNGAEGMIKFCEDHVRIPIYPEGEKVARWCLMKNLPREIIKKTGKSYWDIWEEQKKILRECLAMDDEGFFIYKLIVFCWMRGEGKSLIVCLIQLWKFFCWPRQQIMLCATSKEQTKFVHYDIMRDIILNSGDLLRSLGGKKNVQEKEIRKRDSAGRVTSIIRSISSFSGLRSNITGYTFSEFFEMKCSKDGGRSNFFSQIDGSLRNVPNALGTIDTTVSSKNHILYGLFCDSVLEKKTKTVYFSYRSSVQGIPEDYWNPNMDADQLNDFRIKLPVGDFERYFLNIWSAGAVRIFTDEMIQETKIMGIDGGTMNHKEIVKHLNDRTHLKMVADDMAQKGFSSGVFETNEKIKKINARFTLVDKFYQLRDDYGKNSMCSLEQLNQMGDLFKTNWAILAGADYSDPMAIRSNARTIGTLCAKGLPGSRDNTFLDVNTAPKYIYFLLCLIYASNKDLNILKEKFEECHDEYRGIDTMCSERYGAWDLSAWCEDRDIKFEPVYPTYDRQKEGFGELYTLYREGRFKRTAVGIPGTKKEDIIDEESEVFDHDPDRRWYGSPEKREKYGASDDAIYSLNWCLYGGRFLTADDFRIRTGSSNFGFFQSSEGLLGRY